MIVYLLSLCVLRFGLSVFFYVYLCVIVCFTRRVSLWLNSSCYASTRKQIGFNFVFGYK